MIIKNLTKNAVLSEDARLCRGFSKYIGLMFSKKKTLVFEFKKEEMIPIHMFFVFFPICLIYLDKNKRVVEIKRNLEPFSYYTPKNKAKYLIEVPNGMIDKTKTGVRDRLNF